MVSLGESSEEIIKLMPDSMIHNTPIILSLKMCGINHMKGIHQMMVSTIKIFLKKLQYIIMKEKENQAGY